MRCPTLSELPSPQYGRTGWPWTVENSQMPDTMPDGRPWPKISIVTPSFNQGQFIEETIRSILLQGYPNMEYIIIDGGSKDETISIIHKYEKWITHWVSEPDRGQSHAINKGWERATGDFVSWLNSDDYLMPGWAMDSVLALVNGSDAELVCMDNLIVNSQSQPLSVFKGSNPVLEIVITYWIGPFPQQGFLMRREILSKYGFLDEQLHHTMDFDYWVRLLMKGVKIKYIPKVLAVLRDHPATKTSNTQQVGISNLIQVTEKFYKEAPTSLRNIAEKAKRRAYWNAAYCALVGGDKELARQYAFQYLRIAGLIALPKVFSLYVLSLLGNYGNQLFQVYRIFRSTLHKTPYGMLKMNSRSTYDNVQTAEN